jgi:hypothetical protein
VTPFAKLAPALILATSTLLAVPAFAADIDGTFEAQRLRINAGLASGVLKPREVDRLRAEQTRIATMIARARVRYNGRVAGHERREIERAQANAARHISAATHDGGASWGTSERGGRHIDDSGMRRDR